MPWWSLSPASPAHAWLAAHGVALTGPIALAPSWPPTFTLPVGRQWLQAVEFSIALMFILYAESYSSIRTYASSTMRIVQPNRDLFALGVANLLAGSSTERRSAPATRARPRTRPPVPVRAGAGLSAAFVVLALVLMFLRWIERIPEPVLAAIVIHAVSKSLSPTCLPLRTFSGSAIAWWR